MVEIVDGIKGSILKSYLNKYQHRWMSIINIVNKIYNIK